VCAIPAESTPRVLGGFALARCRDCGLVFAPSALGVEVDYGAIYGTPEYEECQVRERHADAHGVAGLATFRPFFRRVRRQGGGRLLDVGCGVGRFCRAAAAHGWAVRGIDVSPEAIRIGREAGGVALQVGSIADVVAAGDRFDAITVFEVLEHTADPSSMLRAARDALVPGGHFFATVPNWNCDDVRSATRPDWVPPVHKLFFTRESVAALVRRAGFGRVRTGLVRTDAVPRRPWNLARWIWRRWRGTLGPDLGVWVHARRGSR